MSDSNGHTVRPLVHIGYHKTATTWLQRVLFVSREIGFAPPLHPWRDVAVPLVLKDSLSFDPHTCRTAFHGSIEQSEKSLQIPVISCERLSGDPFLGIYDGKEIADRIAGVFPEAKILIVIREQKDMIVSTYKHYVKIGGIWPLRTFLRPPDRPWINPIFNANHFSYHALISHYQKLFGEDRVLVLEYELFKTRPNEFTRRIVRFAGAGGSDAEITGLPYTMIKNPGLSSTTIGIKRQLNRFSGTLLNPDGYLSKHTGDRLLHEIQKLERLIVPKARRSADEELKNIVDDVVGDIYCQSNRYTEQLIGRSLKEFGYEV